MGKKITSIKVIKPGSSPDIDSDFNTEIRDLAIEHVTDLYGKDNVANIITYNTLAAKSSFKEMCTIYNIPFMKANQISALIPDPIEGRDIKLSEIFDPEHERYSEGDEFRAAVSDEYWKDIIAGAIAIEGRTKSIGMHPCFVAGTLVLTDKGYKAIEDVERGDKVLTHRNEFKEVRELQRSKNNDLYKLRTPNSLPIIATGDHPMYVIETEKRRGGKVTDKTPIWKDVRDLDVKNDYIGVPINDQSIIPEVEGIPVNNPNFWWLVGRFLGDGWVEDYYSNSTRVKKDGERYSYKRHVKNIVISVGKNAPDREELFSIVNQLFYNRVSEDGETYKVYIAVSKAPELFSFLKQFGKFTHGKEVPLFVEYLPTLLLKKFVEGYLSADGYTVEETNTHSFNTVSKRLFLGMIRCINKVYNNSCNVVVDYREGPSKIQGRDVQIRDRYIANFTKDKRKKSRSFFKDGYLWVHITDLEKLESKEEETYNLSVVDDNSYTANNLIAHNCGIVMSDKPLTDVLPLYVRQRDGRVMTQWEYESLESLGLVKMDFLGLDTVDLIQHTLENIKKNNKTPPNMIDFIHGPMNDKKTFDMIKSGQTMGIFQFSSSGIQELLIRMEAREFNDLIAANALYRPGPMASNSHLIYADRRAGREKSKQNINPEFDGSILEEILESTAGLIVFQEQIIQIANQVGGLTLQEGDDLRSAMGKKQLDKMAKIKPKFIQGGMDNGFSEKAVNDLWDTMEPFARYAFNKSHSVAYSMNAIQAAYLKAHYPIEFISALISQHLADKSKVLSYLKEARDMGLEISTVSINRSDVRVAPNYSEEDDGVDIVYGLSGVSAVSSNTATEIIKEREQNGDFESIQDFVNRCQKKNIGNRRVYQNLALAGAFDEFGISRRSIVENLDLLMKESKNREEKGESLFDLFEMDEEEIGIDFTSIEEYDWVTKLKLEADVIGLFLTGHPLDNLGTGLSNLSTSTIKDILEQNENTRATMAVSVVDIQRRTTKRGKRVKITIDDGTGYLEVYLSQPIIRGIDKKNAINRVKALYENGEISVPAGYPNLIANTRTIPMEDLEKNSVYLINFTYRKGTTEYPYMARAENITPLTLGKNGRLPIRIRIDEEVVGKRMADRLETALAKNLHEKRSGEYPIFQARYRRLNPPDVIDEEALAAIQEIQDSKEKVDNRVWPPTSDINFEEEINDEVLLDNKIYTIETLEYVDTGYTAEKDGSTQQAIEKFVGDEGYDFGAFDYSIYEM